MFSNFMSCEMVRRRWTYLGLHGCYSCSMESISQIRTKVFRCGLEDLVDATSRVPQSVDGSRRFRARFLAVEHVTFLSQCNKPTETSCKYCEIWKSQVRLNMR